MILSTDNISLTHEGFVYASNLWHSLKDEEKVTIIETKEEFNKMKTDELIAYIYNHYPKFSGKSALKKESVDEYFNKFWKENELSDNYFVQIVRESRQNNA
jgi:hypothetical protein